MSITKRYIELKETVKQNEKELAKLKAEIMEKLGDAPLKAIDGCAVSLKVVSGYETISAASLKDIRANETLEALIKPFISKTADKVSLNIVDLQIKKAS